MFRQATVALLGAAVLSIPSLAYVEGGPFARADSPSTTSGSPPSSTAISSIKWGNCSVPTGGLPLQCGKLAVPLDWLDKSDNANKTMIQLELIKMPAKTQPAPRGSILLNFGGPGQDGLNNLAPYYALQQPIYGDDFDAISWDPRGTRNTLTFNCWPAESDVGSQLSLLGSDWWNASDTTPGKIWAEETVVSQLCYDAHKKIGSYIGMASVARDMIAIVDALPDKDKMLRYWGISGGTVLGATVAAMFPERVDKVILDGVLNVHQYYGSSAENEWFDSTDATFIGVLEACLEVGSSKCPLANHGTTVDELVAVWEASLEDIKYNPLPYAIPSEAGPVAGIIRYSDYLAQVFGNLYRPLEYASIAVAIDAVARRDAEALIATILGPSPANNTEDSSEDEVVDTAPVTRAVYGIRCGDKRAPADSFEDIEGAISNSVARSKWFWSFGVGPNVMLCAQWKFEAKDRYEGGFDNIKTNKPVLVVGNTYDPVTPAVSAHNISMAFEGSVALEINAFGHTSIVPGSESDCAYGAMRAYLYDGIMPANGTVCETNKKLAEIWGTK